LRMVGRQAALKELDARLNESVRGHRQVVFVTGDAGIGKTTLVDVFHQRAVTQSNVRWDRGQCVEGFAGKEAYYPILEAFGHLGRAADAGTVLQVIAAQAPT